MLLEESSLKAEDRRPPFNIYKIAVPNYSHLGVSGELQVQFFNNRLVSTWFYPETFDQYIKVFKGKGEITFPEGREGPKEATAATYTHIWTHKDYKGHEYVAWEDVRLARELSLWINRYS